MIDGDPFRSSKFTIHANTIDMTLGFLGQVRVLGRGSQDGEFARECRDLAIGTDLTDAVVVAISNEDLATGMYRKTRW